MVFFMSNLLKNPPKHTCKKCNHSCDYHTMLGKYAIFSCPNCEKKMSVWQGLAYLLAVGAILKWALYFFEMIGVSSLVMVGGLFVAILILLVFAGFGNHIWTIKVKNLNNDGVHSWHSNDNRL